MHRDTLLLRRKRVNSKFYKALLPLDSNMNDKIIIGVEHGGKEELGRVIDAIDGYSPKSIAMELPEDYETREMFGMGITFFGDIFSHLKGNGITVIPLESPEIYEDHWPIEYAKAVIEGHIEKRQIDSWLVDSSIPVTGFTAQEVAYTRGIFKNRCEKTLEILRDNSNLEQVTALWEESNKRREAHMLKRVQSQSPDVIVVGDGHAVPLKESLPEYQHATFY